MRLSQNIAIQTAIGFQSTHPLRGATKPVQVDVTAGSISIHAPLAGCDKGLLKQIPSALHFNPRTPCGVRPRRLSERWQAGKFQSTHPLRGATDYVLANCYVVRISIHAPLAGCDLLASLQYASPAFQSTHPLRGATLAEALRRMEEAYFNPRTPCGVRHNDIFVIAFSTDFNPRTPCGVRQRDMGEFVESCGFQSTHPLRGATPLMSGHTSGEIFQSTHPLRGATGGRGDCPPGRAISIHAPLAGCDPILYTAPQTQDISIHAPLAGCDGGDGDISAKGHAISIHAPLAGCDMLDKLGIKDDYLFQSTHPLRGATMRALAMRGQAIFQSTHPLRGATAKTYKENCTFLN